MIIKSPLIRKLLLHEAKVHTGNVSPYEIFKSHVRK